MSDGPRPDHKPSDHTYTFIDTDGAPLVVSRYNHHALGHVAYVSGGSVYVTRDDIPAIVAALYEATA